MVTINLDWFIWPLNFHQYELYIYCNGINLHLRCNKCDYTEARTKMADDLQMTFSNAFSWMKTDALWCFFSEVSSYHRTHWQKVNNSWQLDGVRQRATAWSNIDPDLCYHITSLALQGLTRQHLQLHLWTAQVVDFNQWLLSLTWFNYNPSMDK